MAFSALEAEIIGLKAATASLDDLLNHSLCSLTGHDPDSQVSFPDAEHQRLFNILLLDTLERASKELLGEAGSLIDALHRIAAAPLMAPVEAAEELRVAVGALEQWLNTDIVVDIWLPSLDQTVALQLQRADFIYICGNIGKHGLARRTGVAGRLQCILEASGVIATREEVLEVLERFYERFHEDILTYHATGLAELLNNVRWGIHEYLRPEYDRALRTEVDAANPLRYAFEAPPGISSEFARRMHWDLMNEVRSGPYLRRFVGTSMLKLRY